MNLSDKQKEEQPLLELELGIILPSDINYNSYFEMLWALKYAESVKLGDSDLSKEEIKLYCNGDGGQARDALAIVDIIQSLFAPVSGIIVGEACSANSVIWAACSKRFVSKRASIGIHKISYQFKGQTDDTGWNTYQEKDIDLMKRKYKEGDQIVASIYADACKQNPVNDNRVFATQEWWLDEMAKGGQQLWRISAYKLVDMGMAEFL